MARNPQKTRAARAGLARGLDDRRLRRNAGKQALSRLELGEGLRLDSKSRLEITPEALDIPRLKGLRLLQDNLAVSPSEYVVQSIPDIGEPDTSYTAEELRTDLIDNILPVIREDLATLTKRVNEIVSQLSED